MSDTGKTIALIKALAHAPEIDPEQVKQNVEDWLDDHPEATTTVQDGAITKAKLNASLQGTVDDVDALKSAVKENEELTIETIESANKWNQDTAIEGYRLNSDGSLLDNSNIIVSDFITIPDGFSYVLGCANYSSTASSWSFSYGRMGFYKADKSFIEPLYNSTLAAVAIPDNAKYVRVDFPKTYDNKYVAFSNQTSLPVYVPYSTEKVNIALDALQNYVPEISQDNMTFAEFVEPENLVDITNENQCKPGWWYYSTSVGSVIAPTELASQYNYTAITAKVYDAEKITIDLLPHQADMNNQPKIYWVGAADADMKLLAYSTVDTRAPVTYTLPEGAVYFLASPNIKDAQNLGKLMVVKGEAATKYVEGKGERYLLDGCMIDADNIETQINTGLKLPNNYDLVVGDTFQLFKKGIVNAANPDVYDVRFECSKGSNYTRFFEITPTTAETLELTVYLYDADHNLIDNKTVTLTVRAKKTSPASNVNVLCVGDSLTTGGVWPYELKRRLTGSGGTPEGDGLSNITFIGTRQANGTNYEGYGGWTFTQYNTANVSSNVKIITCSHDKTEADDQHSIYKDGLNLQWKLETIGSGQIKIIAINNEGRDFPATGTLTWVSGGTHHSDIVYTASENAEGNPFWDSTQEKVDFSTYAARIGASGIDYVLVLLGWNSAADNETDYKAKAQTFIDNVQASYPDAKIVLLGLEVPARDGLGVNYGASGIYADYYRLMQFVFNLDKWYQDLADENENVYHINLAGQFDTDNNMSTSQRQVNTRNTATETIQSNGVHPATPGYLQIADAMYRAIEGLM